jgi:hypothetical protein
MPGKITCVYTGRACVVLAWQGPHLRPPGRLASRGSATAVGVIVWPQVEGDRRAPNARVGGHAHTCWAICRPAVGADFYVGLPPGAGGGMGAWSPAAPHPINMARTMALSPTRPQMDGYTSCLCTLIAVPDAAQQESLEALEGQPVDSLNLTNPLAAKRTSGGQSNLRTSVILQR